MITIEEAITQLASQLRGQRDDQRRRMERDFCPAEFIDEIVRRQHIAHDAVLTRCRQKLNDVCTADGRLRVQPDEIGSGSSEAKAH